MSAKTTDFSDLQKHEMAAIIINDAIMAKRAGLECQVGRGDGVFTILIEGYEFREGQILPVAAKVGASNE